jgi:hypothetical protein
MTNAKRAGVTALALLTGIAGAPHWPHRAEADGPSPVALNVPAPELVGREWRNTSGNAPLTLAGQRGKVTILHFWTFG